MYRPDPGSRAGVAPPHAGAPPRPVIALVVLVVATACSGDREARSNENTRAEAHPEAASAPSVEPGSDELLCDVMEEDEALTPDGSEPLEIPGVGEANSERRCMLAFGVDMPIEDVRSFYRASLERRGFEIDEFVEGEGIARGNLSRTLVRASKPGLQVSMTLDEFDPDETPIAQYEIQGKLQFDVVRR